MARGSIVKRSSGNYAIVYYVGGKQKWETMGPSRREAERALTARKREVDTGTWREPSSETLASYAERWLAHRDPARVGGGGRTRLSPSTFEGYRLNLRTHVLPRLGSRTLSSVRTQDVDRLIAELEADGKAPGTVRNVVVPLRKMLADAVRQGLLLANPAARADLPPAQDFVGKEIPPAHADAIRQALVELAPLDALRREPDLFFVYLFDVALGTGLRLGEVRALRWRDVDRDRRLIRVERAYSRQHVRKPKTESGVRSPSSRQSKRRSASWLRERSSAVATRPTSSSLERFEARRYSRRTSGSASGIPPFAALGSTASATASTTSGTRVCRASSRPVPT
jgi:integrase